MTDAWLIYSNAAICAGVAAAALVRLNATTHRTQPAIRLQFVLLLAGALASALQTLVWGEVPSGGSVLLSAALLIYMSLGLRRWLHGAPPDTQSDWMGLSTPPAKDTLEIHS